MSSVLNSTLIDFGKERLKPNGSLKRGPRIDVSMSMSVLMFVSVSVSLFSSVSACRGELNKAKSVRRWGIGVHIRPSVRFLLPPDSLYACFPA